MAKKNETLEVVQEKFRDRKFSFLLYPDDATHVNALEIIKKSYDYAYILHNQDIDKTGNIKKEHWHVLIAVGKNQLWSSAICKELGIEHNYIRKVRNFDRALEYLIHLNDSNKHLYSIDEVYGSLKVRLSALINSSDKTEDEKIIDIVDMLNNINLRLSMKEYVVQCAEMGVYDVLRRSGYIGVRMLDEHNQEILEKQYRERQEALTWSNAYSKRTGEIYPTPFDYKQNELNF